MIVAVDLDGTLSKYPRQLKTLIECLVQCGQEVFMLTACAGELPEEERPAEARRRVRAYGVTIPVIWCHTHEKPEVCRQRSVDLLIDDVPFDNLPFGTAQLIPKN